MVILPFGLLLLRIRARDWSLAAFAAPAALAMLLLMWSVDNLFNAMHNPIYIIAAGGLSGLYLAYPRLLSQHRAMQQQYAMMLMAQRQAMVQRQAVAAPSGHGR
jgi:hypothetical protein